MLSGELFCPACGYCSLARISLTNVKFVSNEHEDYFWFCMILYFIDPLFNIFESLFFCYIINQQCTQTFTVMSRCYCFESLLTSQINNKLDTHHIIHLINYQLFNYVLTTENSCLSNFQNKDLQCYLTYLCPIFVLLLFLQFLAVLVQLQTLLQWSGTYFSAINL